MLFALLAAAALADEPPSRGIDPRFLPQAADALPEGALKEARDPIAHPF